MPDPTALANWLSDAKRIHSGLPTDFPPHRWEDFYADYLVARWAKERQEAQSNQPALHAPAFTSYDY